MATPAKLMIDKTYVGGNAYSLTFQVLSDEGKAVPGVRIVVVSSKGTTEEIRTDVDGFAVEQFSVGTDKVMLRFIVPGSDVSVSTTLYPQSR